MLTKQKNELDRIWSRIIKSRGTCEVCGQDGWEPHHIKHRSNLATRWLIENGCLLCNFCHITSSRFSAHKTPTDFHKWIEKKRGKDVMDKLESVSKKISKPDYNTIKKYLEEELSKLMQ
jgi:NAD-dependent dihydropyrimidine dehydrogenase PreA subunit